MEEKLDKNAREEKEQFWVRQETGAAPGTFLVLSKYCLTKWNAESFVYGMELFLINNFTKGVLLLSLFCKWQNWGSEL